MLFQLSGGYLSMSNAVTIGGKKPRKGKRMTKGAGWRLATTKGRKRVFAGTLLKTFNIGKKRLALFFVRKVHT